jgi:hypothetical protein
MKIIKLFLLLLILLCGFNSCRYSLPVVKLRVKTNIITDSSSMSVTKKIHYRYFRISRYGILGACSKSTIRDSTGKKEYVTIYKVSNRVCDGYTTSLSKEKEFKKGKRVRKKIELEKSRGWFGRGTHKEKTIKHQDGKRKVTMERSPHYQKHKRSKGEKERLTW